jgi:hypothetical protein
MVSSACLHLLISSPLSLSVSESGWVVIILVLLEPRRSLRLLRSTRPSLISCKGCLTPAFSSLSISSSLYSGVHLNQHIQTLSLPAEFSSKTNEQILAYLRELQRSHDAPTELFRMRVMITGPGDAGKTTLVHRLLTNEFAPRQFSMTDGVSMKEWRPTVAGEPASLPPSLTLFSFNSNQ